MSPQRTSIFFANTGYKSFKFNVRFIGVHQAQLAMRLVLLGSKFLSGQRCRQMLGDHVVPDAD